MLPMRQDIHIMKENTEAYLFYACIGIHLLLEIEAAVITKL